MIRNEINDILGRDSKYTENTENTESTAIERLRQGNSSARIELMEQNMWVVYYAAKKYASANNIFEDLVSIANLGLVKAMYAFDPDRNVKPSSFAMKCIKNEFYMYFRRNSKLAREISLELPLAAQEDGQELSIGDVISTENEIVWEEVLKKQRSSELIRAVNSLDKREKCIMDMRFGLSGEREHTQAEVAARLNVTQSYISKVEKRLLKKIRNMLE